MKIKAKQKIHNHFDFMLESSAGWEKVAVAENVVLDQLYDKYFKVLRSYRAPLAYIALGTGTAEPATTDTGLKQSKIVKAMQARFCKWDTEIGCYVLTGYIELNSTEGNALAFSEVGIQSYSTADSYIVYCTRALVKDANGNPISITKSSTEKLRVYATVYIYPMEYFDTTYAFPEVFTEAPEARSYWPLLEQLVYKNFGDFEDRPPKYLVAECIQWATQFNGLSKVPTFGFKSTYSGHATGNYNMWRPGSIPGENNSLWISSVGWGADDSVTNAHTGKFYLAENRIPNTRITGISVCLASDRGSNLPISVLPMQNIEVPIADLGLGDGVVTEFALPHAQAKNLQIKVNGAVNNNYTLNTKNTKRINLWSPQLQSTVFDNDGVFYKYSYRNLEQSPAIRYKEGYLEIWRTTLCPGYYFGTYVHEVDGQVSSEFVKIPALAELPAPPTPQSQRNNWHYFDTTADGSILTVSVLDLSSGNLRNVTTHVYRYDYVSGQVLKYLGTINGFLVIHTDGTKALLSSDRSSNGYYTYAKLGDITFNEDSFVFTERSKTWATTRSPFCPLDTPFLTNRFATTYSSDTATYTINWDNYTISKQANVGENSVQNERPVTIGEEKIIFRRPNSDVFSEYYFPPLIEIPAEQSITFVTPPAPGAAITASYTLDYLPKDSNWTMDLDFSVAISRGSV